MARADSQGAECLVVGGGLAGLACAQALSAEGYTVQLLEASDAVCGRARGALHLGEPYDLGFQVILSAYEATTDFLEAIGIGADDLHTFQRSMAVHDGTTWRRLRAAGTGGFLTSGFIPRRDALRLAAAAGRWALSGGAEPKDDDAGMSGEAWLRSMGLSDRTIDRVLRPFIGAMLLDRSLSADAAYVRFLLGALARGPAMLPADGMSMIAERATWAVTRAGGMIWTDVPVASINLGADGRATGVTLADGRTINAQTVVVALDARAARELLMPVDRTSAEAMPTEFLGAVSATFALSDPLYRDATILLNGAGGEVDDRVDLICQTTNVTRPGSPGPYMVTAQSATATWSSVDPDRFAGAVGAFLTRTIPGFSWSRAATLVDARHHPHAQFRIPPGARAKLPDPVTAIPNVLLAGDCTAHPSIEGAVSSGYRAAGLVSDLLS